MKIRAMLGFVVVSMTSLAYAGVTAESGGIGGDVTGAAQANQELMTSPRVTIYRDGGMTLSAGAAGEATARFGTDSTLATAPLSNRVNPTVMGSINGHSNDAGDVTLPGVHLAPKGHGSQNDPDLATPVDPNRADQSGNGTLSPVAAVNPDVKYGIDASIGDVAAPNSGSSINKNKDGFKDFIGK